MEFVGGTWGLTWSSWGSGGSSPPVDPPPRLNGYPRILGTWIMSLVQILAHGFADLDIRNTVGLERILYFTRGWSSTKLSLISPHREP
jgi:hypothetical protein